MIFFYNFDWKHSETILGYNEIFCTGYILSLFNKSVLTDWSKIVDADTYAGAVQCGT